MGEQDDSDRAVTSYWWAGKCNNPLFFAAEHQQFPHHLATNLTAEMFSLLNRQWYVGFVLLNKVWSVIIKLLYFHFFKYIFPRNFYIHISAVKHFI